MKACASCRHWLPEDQEDGQGVCRRHPPSVLILGTVQTIRGPQPQLVGVFPPVSSEAVCGDHDAIPVVLHD